jgi:hypothetical protein
VCAATNPACNFATLLQSGPSLLGIHIYCMVTFYDWLRDRSPEATQADRVATLIAQAPEGISAASTPLLLSYQIGRKKIKLTAGVCSGCQLS